MAYQSGDRSGPPEIISGSMAYEAVADEYYDSFRHPTCTNFREASGIIIEQFLSQPGNTLTGNPLCDLGAGSSLLAEHLQKQNVTLRNLILIDSSEAMIAHSSSYRAAGAQLVVAEAERLPLPSASVEGVVISLGDPFNTTNLWKEIFRVLGIGGWCIFTTPSHEWAQAFRSSSPSERADFALFSLQTGDEIYLPSRIYPPNEQIKIFKAFGLRCVSALAVHASELKTPLSPKLKFEAYPAVRGYAIRKVSS